MSGAVVAGHFVTGSKGPLFVLVRRPTGPINECVLVVPPFAEEMNKSRRMLTLVGEGLAHRGCATVIPDLYGTGDSAGEFGETDCETWLADIEAVANWLAAEVIPVTALLAVRLGCALALNGIASGVLSAPRKSVLWQPVFDGDRYLTQFLRLRVAASLTEDRRESVVDLKARLMAGGTLEVAGYDLSARMAADLSRMAPPQALPPQFGATAWLEIVRDPDAGPPLPSAQLVKATNEAGGKITARCFAGEPYWASTETVVNADVVTSTLEHLAGTQGE